MKKTITFLLGIFACGFLAQAQLQLEAASQPAVVDGIVDADDPWGETWIDLALPKGTEEHTAKFQIMNDADNLYLVVSVTDATVDNSSETEYQRDNVEFFTSFRIPTGDNPEPKVADQDFQFRTGRDGRVTGDLSAEDATDAYETVVMTDDAGYIIEYSFPLETLINTTDFDGVNFRFDIQVADAKDGARTGQLFWAGDSDLQWSEVQAYGAAKLAEVSAIKHNVAKTNILLTTVVKNGTIKFNSGVDVKILSVHNSIGQVVANSTNVANLPKGVYIVKAKTSKGVFANRFVIQ
jgi:hypothetical protein